MPVRFRLMSVRTACLGGAAALVLTAAACSSSSSPTGSSSPTSSAQGSSSSSPFNSSPAIKTGGSITVLESSGYSGSWTTLDPAQNKEGAATQDFMTAIYGQLFELGTGGKIVPDLALNYKFSSDAKDVTITLRQGVKFSDGTPFNAQAVADNWNRDLGTIGISNGLNPPWLIAQQAAPKGSPPGTPEPQRPGCHRRHRSVHDRRAPDLAQRRVHRPALRLDRQLDRLADRAQEARATAFGQKPVGAGPFTVVSNVPNTELVVKKNPTYWETGQPYLDQLTFKTVGSDEAAYEALLAGQGQVYENMSTSALIDQSEQHLPGREQPGHVPVRHPAQHRDRAVQQPQGAAGDLLRHRLRRDPPAHLRGRYPITQGFTGPGGLFYEQNVPGYQATTRRRPRRWSSELGGQVTIQLGTINVLLTAQTDAGAAHRMGGAGIKTQHQVLDLGPLIQAFQSQAARWPAMLQTAGAYDPAAGVGVAFRFASQSPFSGVHDPKLDGCSARRGYSTDLTPARASTTRPPSLHRRELLQAVPVRLRPGERRR